jgi:hypothetical protein
MHIRLSRFAGLDPERIDETLHQFQEQELPNLEQQKGFSGITVGVNRRSGQAVAVALWENEVDMRESEKAAAQARERAIATAKPERDPVVDHYEVIFQK